MDKKIIYNTPEIQGTPTPPDAADCMSSYELVYMLDAEHKYAFIFGETCGNGASCAARSAAAHEKYHKAAFAGKQISYDWKCCGVCYRTNLLPLGAGKISHVLGIVSKVTGSCAPANMVRDGGATLSQVLLKTREDEKKKIAGALHDEIGTTAVILTSILSILESDIKENKKTAALRRAGEMDVKIKECVDRLKNLIVTMRPPSIDSVGLEDAVKELVEHLNEVAPVKIKYFYEEDGDGQIDDEVKIMLYRVVQESLNNALRHAAAQNIEVTLQNLKNLVKIEVRDNGRGFKPAGKPTAGHLGLRSMKESVKYLGGKFQIKTGAGKGTAVSVSCPKVIYKVGI